MDTTHLFGFWAVALTLIAIPGPDWAFIVACGTHDRRVLPAVAGLMLGYGGISAAVALGIGTWIGHTPLLLTLLTIVGALFLGYLGISGLVPAGAEPLDHSQGPEATREDLPTARSQVGRGIGVSALNPKGLVIFVSLLPQFVDQRGSWPLSLQLVALGLVFVLTCGAFYASFGLAWQRIFVAAPATALILGRVSGISMVAVSALLLFDGIRLHR